MVSLLGGAAETSETRAFALAHTPVRTVRLVSMHAPLDPQLPDQGPLADENRDDNDDDRER